MWTTLIVNKYVCGVTFDLIDWTWLKHQLYSSIKQTKPWSAPFHFTSLCLSLAISGNEDGWFRFYDYKQGFLRCFRDPIRVPRIENRVPRIKENYHRVPKIRENRVPRSREIRSLQVHTGYLTSSLKKAVISVKKLKIFGKYEKKILNYVANNWMKNSVNVQFVKLTPTIWSSIKL